MPGFTYTVTLTSTKRADDCLDKKSKVHRAIMDLDLAIHRYFERQLNSCLFYVTIYVLRFSFPHFDSFL
jgi:hypothetical protein